MTKHTCKTCGRNNSGHYCPQLPIASPKENDVSVCIYCGEITKFDKELNLIPIEKTDFIDLEKNHIDTLIILQQTSFLIRKRNAQS